MNLLNSKFQEIKFDATKKRFYIKWINSDKMKEIEYRDQLILQAELFEAHHPSSALIDTSTFVFLISPSLQEWNNEHILQRVIKAGLRKAALLVAPELFAQIAIEQNMEEETTNTLQFAYFESEDEGIAWLDGRA